MWIAFATISIVFAVPSVLAEPICLDRSFVLVTTNEAAALAWATQYPLLVFPVLFAERLEAGLTQSSESQPANMAGAGLEVCWR